MSGAILSGAEIHLRATDRSELSAELCSGTSGRNHPLELLPGQAQPHGSCPEVAACQRTQAEL